MKLCNNCGTPLKDTDAFCRKCGQKMGGGNSPVPMTQQIIVTNKPREANPPAIASFIVSLLSLLTLLLIIPGLLLATVAILLGLTGLDKCKKQGKGNHGLAVTGITIGFITIGILTLMILVSILFFPPMF